jgi:hypothetical protein
MRHDDICVITRTTTKKDPITHIAKPQLPITLEPFKCRLGKSSGTLVQAQPQAVFTKQLRLYIPNILVDIKSGDIANVTIVKLNTTNKYIVGNVYYPNNHHIEADVTYKEEV